MSEQLAATTDEYTPSWLHVLRHGFLPLLTPEQLRWLRQLAETDDARLIQGDTTLPDPDAIDPAYIEPQIDPEGEACVAACLIGCLALVQPNQTVADVQSFFARMCWEIDARIGEPTGARHLTTWFDDAPRATMLKNLIYEIDREMSQRERGNNVNSDS